MLHKDTDQHSPCHINRQPVAVLLQDIRKDQHIPVDQKQHQEKVQQKAFFSGQLHPLPKECNDHRNKCQKKQAFYRIDNTERRYDPDLAIAHKFQHQPDGSQKPVRYFINRYKADLGSRIKAVLHRQIKLIDQKTDARKPGQQKGKCNILPVFLFVSVSFQNRE